MPMPSPDDTAAAPVAPAAPPAAPDPGAGTVSGLLSEQAPGTSRRGGLLGAVAAGLAGLGVAGITMHSPAHTSAADQVAASRLPIGSRTPATPARGTTASSTAPRSTSPQGTSPQGTPPQAGKAQTATGQPTRDSRPAAPTHPATGSTPPAGVPVSSRPRQPVTRAALATAPAAGAGSATPPAATPQRPRNPQILVPKKAADAIDRDASAAQAQLASGAADEHVNFEPEATGLTPARIHGSKQAHITPNTPSAAAARARQRSTIFGAAGSLSTAQAQAHLLRRATFGARPSDRTALAKMGIDAWITSQLSPSTVADPDGQAISAQFNIAGTSIPAVVGSITRYSWDAQFEVAQSVLARQIFSKRQVFEMTVDVFANLLNCTTPSDSLWSSGPDYHHAVIRRHSFGRYRDMLIAAMRHPAMITYLGNDESTREHVNENLGRELLELHTVGVAAGYSEADVVASAKILSGRTIDWRSQVFTYDRTLHFVGPVTVMGFSDANADATTGLQMGDRYLAWLAARPQTAQTVARRLALRFVSDTPSQALLDQLARVYLSHDTNIVPVLRAIFESTEFWASVGQKTRRPGEDLVASARALDIPLNADRALAKKAIRGMYWRLWDTGHPPLGWAPPNGYPEVAAAWQSAGQVLQRFSTHRALASGWYDGMKPTTAEAALTPRANETIPQWIDRISVFLIGGVLPASARTALVTYLGAPDGTLASSGWVNWQGRQLAALILDTLYVQLR